MPQHATTKGLRVFIFIWFGQLVSLIGSELTNFSLSVWIYDRTGSVTQFALISLSMSLPLIFISPVAGALVDRWNRRWVMILSDCGAGLSTLAITLLLATGRLETWHIYLATAISSSFSAFQWPAYTASTTLLVPKQYLSRANGMIQLGEAVPRLISPVLAGVLLTIVHLRGIILLDFISFFFSLVILLNVRFPKTQNTALRKTRTSSLLSEVAYGWKYIIARPGLLGLLIFFGITNFRVGVVQVLVTPLVLSFASPTALGTILSIGGIGMLVGSLVISTYGGFGKRIKTMFGFMLLGGLCITIAGLQTSVTLLTVAAFFFFLGLPFINVSIQVIFQKKVESHVQGRVFALIGAIGNSSLPLAYVVAGPLADRVFEPLMTANGALAGSLGLVIGVGPGRGIGLMFAVMGVLTMIVTVAGYRYPRLRLVENELPDVADGSAEKDERLKAYRNLIGVLLTYPNQATKILDANKKLVDTALVQEMEEVASQMAANGSLEASNFLRKLTVKTKWAFYQCPRLRSLENDMSEMAASKAADRAECLEVYRKLIVVFLTYPHKAAKILEGNQKLLDPDLVQMMEQVASEMAANGSVEASDFLRGLIESQKSKVPSWKSQVGSGKSQVVSRKSQVAS